MSKKLLILTFGLLLMLAWVFSTATGEKRELTPVEEGQTAFEPPETDSKAPCYWQWYYCNVGYFWRTPHPTYGDLSYAQRFSPACSETLMGANVYIYDEGDGTFGNDDVYVTVYDDDGTGLPGLQRAQVTLTAGTYPAFPVPAYANFSGFHLVFTGDFHIAFSTSAATGIDYEDCLSDDGTCGQLRSTDQWPDGSWHLMATDWGIDVNFLIEAFMCTDWYWTPGDDYKMHYPQYPDEYGWDVNATYPIILADDWQCSETGWVKDIHFWGSWKDNIEGIVDSFLLSFHYDIPAGVPGPYGTYFNDGDCNRDGIPLSVADLVELVRYVSGTTPPRRFYPWYDFNSDCIIDSADIQKFNDYFIYGMSVFPQYPIPTCGPTELYSRPGETITEMTIKWYGVTPMTSSEQGWFDPVTEEYFENNHWDWYQYDICLPESLWVWQDMDTIYWLNICAFVTNEDIADTAVWGWKSSYMHWNDDAVWAWWGELYWQEMYEPPYYDYIPGDVDHDGDVDVDDATYLQNWVAGSGPPPPYEVGGFYPAADVDGNCTVPTIADLVYLVNYLSGSGPPPVYCPTYPPLCNYGTFGAEFDSLGYLVNGWGSAFYGEGWYYYEWYGWWNMWWYDHPYDTLRKKIIHYEVDFIQVDPSQPANVEFAVNWSSEWWDDETAPPLPPINEDLYIERRTLYHGEIYDSVHMEFDWVVPYYNPIWVSVDVIADNVIIEGDITHCCVQSLDLSFVITGEPPDTFPPPPPPHEGDIIFHNIDDYKPLDGSPMGTRWHELWPNYCELWDLTSWFDNGDGILSVCDYVDFTNVGTTEWRKFHVEWVGPTLTLEWDYDTIYVEYICHDYPLVDTIFNPIGTWWHEVWPFYCESWYIISWDDNGNGYLDYCDWIEIRNYNTGEIRNVHVVSVDTDIIMNEIAPTPPNPLPEGTVYHNEDEVFTDNPLGSLWHELYPTYCEYWRLTSWFDNGDSVLSVCDYVDFKYVPDSTIWKKFHVEWVGWTIELERIDDPNPIYLDLIDPYFVPLDTVIGTYWHEVYPNYCTNHFCVDWIDNGSGVLDSCDYLILQNMDTGEFFEYHVTGIKIDIILDEISPVPPDPLPEGINLHNPSDWRPPAGSPFETYWHELWPNYCHEWLLTSWIDNGDNKLSICDTVDFNYDTTKLYHVEWVGPTIEVESAIAGDTNLYLDYVGYDNPDVANITNVVGTYWHEVWPVFCPYWYIIEWIDNGNGYLDSCDYIVIQNLDDGHFHQYHVVAVQTDMIIDSVSTVCDCEPGNCDGLPALNIFDITYLITYLYMFGPAPVPYALCSGDANCDCICNIFDVTYLITHLYMQGPPPCTCQQWLINCGPPLRK